MYPTRRAVRSLVLPLLLLAPAGCGKGYKLAPVSGRVTMDGRPLAGAEVSFFPADAGKDAPYAVGTTDEEGNYKLETLIGGSTSEGAVVGENHVTISRSRLDGPKKALPVGVPGGLDEVPARYNDKSQLSFSVPPEGSSEANFQLTSR